MSNRKLAKAKLLLNGVGALVGLYVVVKEWKELSRT